MPRSEVWLFTEIVQDKINLFTYLTDESTLGPGLNLLGAETDTKLEKIHLNVLHLTNNGNFYRHEVFYFEQSETKYKLHVTHRFCSK